MWMSWSDAGPPDAFHITPTPVKHKWRLSSRWKCSFVSARSSLWAFVVIPEDEEASGERSRNYIETRGCRRMCACGNANKKDGTKEEKILWKLEGPMAPVCRFLTFHNTRLICNFHKELDRKLKEDGVDLCISRNKKLVNRLKIYRRNTVTDFWGMKCREP